MRQASQKEVQIIAFPELSVTSYTCMDLFSQETLLRNAEKALLDLVNNTADLDLLTIVGCPLVSGSQLINAAVAFQRGEILGVVPKSYLPSYKEFQEERWFTASSHLQQSMITIGNREVPLDCYLIFEYDEVRVGIEICEDLWVPIPPSSELAMQGANLIFNLSASNELIGKHAYLRSLICQQSARCIAGYVYASAGFGESSTDLVFAGNGIIAENGTLLKESERFSMEEQLVISEIDIQNLQNDRRINTSFMQGYLNHNMDNGTVVSFSLPNRTLDLTRAIDPHPFTPSGDALKERCEEIFHIQVAGLAKRILHAHAQTAVVGISGGLDSTLALLVTVMTFDALKIPRDKIIGITMPGFGTTDHTYGNALSIMKLLGTDMREISIADAVTDHFKAIGHDISVRDVTYENAQARERTQILMDIANETGGMVVGTGDLSELALGWATYNGDHMSMYGVNGSIPKTLVRYLVAYEADRTLGELSDVLQDVLDTPVSPELLPPKDGEISQKTEDLVGPYELHDFFLYYTLRYGMEPEDVYDLCKEAVRQSVEASEDGKIEAYTFTDEEIKKWQKVFYTRFFRQQFKRNCMPDGVKVGTVSVSPRGDLRLPSEIEFEDFLTFE